MEKPETWDMTDEELADELQRFGNFFRASFCTPPERAICAIAEGVSRLLRESRQK